VATLLVITFSQARDHKQISGWRGGGGGGVKGEADLHNLAARQGPRSCGCSTDHRHHRIKMYYCVCTGGTEKQITITPLAAARLSFFNWNPLGDQHLDCHLKPRLCKTRTYSLVPVPLVNIFSNVAPYFCIDLHHLQ
jgi:hypothetical protein